MTQPAEFSLAEMKVLRGEVGRRILLGDNTGGGEVMLRPIRFQCAGVRFSAGLRHINIYGRTVA